MNIKDLPKDSYSVEEPSTLNINTLPKDSFSFDQSQAVLAHSQSMIDRFRTEAQQAQIEAEKAAKGTTIAKETAKETAKGTIGVIADTGINLLRSAVQAPIDIGRQLLGKQPDITEQPLPSGKMSKTIQGEFASETIPKVISGEETPLMATAKTVGKTVLGGIDVLSAGGAGKLAVSGAEKGAGIAKTILKKTGVADFFAKRAEKKDFEKALSFAQDFTSRPITTGVAESSIAKGSAGYKPQTFFQKAGIKPTAHDNRVAEASIPYLTKNSSPLGIQKNIDAMKEGVSRTNLAVREMIAENKVPFNEAQLRNKLMMAKEDSKLLFAGDTASEKAYNAVIDEFVNFVNKGKKDTLGLFDSRQSFDSYIKTKLPNAFKKDATGQFLDPKDNIRVNAFLDVRKAANEYVADLLPPNSPYIKFLKDESYVLEAIGRVSSKNKAMFNETRLQSIVKEYPILKYWIGGAIGGGIVAGGAVVGSSD